MNHSEYCKKIDAYATGIADANQARLRCIEGALGERGKLMAQLQLDIQSLETMRLLVLQNIETAEKLQKKSKTTCLKNGIIGNKTTLPT